MENLHHLFIFNYVICTFMSTNIIMLLNHNLIIKMHICKNKKRKKNSVIVTILLIYLFQHSAEMRRKQKHRHTHTHQKRRRFKIFPMRALYECGSHCIQFRFHYFFLFHCKIVVLLNRVKQYQAVNLISLCSSDN